MNKDSRIYVAGHTGLAGSAIVRLLISQGYTDIITRTHFNLQLTQPPVVDYFYEIQKPEYVFMAAARVGGVCSNEHHEVDFLLDNLKIQNNLIEGAHKHGVKKLLFLGSACVYPRLATEPVTEDSLLTGPLELSNQWYAIAKIVGLKLCQAYRRQHGCDFITAMPTNLYGPGDKYDLRSSHVLPALLRKFHEAKLAKATSVTCWGTGTPTREFLHSDDLAVACITLMEKYSDESPVNIGSGEDISIGTLAGIISETVEYCGDIFWDASKPDGTPRRALDGSKMKALGWAPRIAIRDGLRRTYEDFIAQKIPPALVYDSMR